MFVFGLRDPRTKELRYIGLSTDPERRLGEYLKGEGGTARDRWILELIIAKVRPEIEILEQFEVPINWQTKRSLLRGKEVEWHRRLTAQGVTLLNRNLAALSGALRTGT